MTSPELKELFAALAAPFPPDAVSWRIGSTTGDKKRGLALAYIDARDVMDRLDEVLGPDRWQDDYKAVGGTVLCTLSLRLGEGGDWVSKTDGAGQTDVEAEKGQISDAFKRAAVKWGIGRYLYRLDSPWVMLTENSRGIAAHEYPRLRALLGAKEDVGAKASVPSAQATRIGDDFKACKTLSELQATGAGKKKEISALHMIDRRYLTEIYETRHAELKPSPDKELVA